MAKAMLAMLGLLALSTVAEAAPSVFVRANPPYGWWTAPMESRILGKEAGPVTTEELSAYLQDTMLYSPYSVCSLEAVQTDTFVGLDREAQAEIEATGTSASWGVESVTPDGRRVLAQSVVFEACYEGDPRGGALLVTDLETGEILRWEPLGDRMDEQGRSYPSWVVFLNASEGDELLSYSGCTECGDRTNVYYDVTRRRIYTEHNGH